jgi:membrane-associated phospholipid phosphatase
VTWHAAWFLILEALTLVFAAFLLVVAWLVAHRGRVISESSGLFPRGGLSWLRILLGIVIIAASLMWFASILRGVLTDGRVVAADHRLHNTLRYFRSEALHLAYSAITNLGGTIFIAPVTLLLAMVFWMHRRNHDATIFVISLLGAEILSFALKYIVRRPRPSDAARLVPGPSFPSGHTLAATAVYGILIFLLLREQPRRRWHVAAMAPLIALIPLIPISRVYLGVHWPHDVTASVSLGCAWLACLTMWCGSARTAASAMRSRIDFGPPCSVDSQRRSCCMRFFSLDSMCSRRQGHRSRRSASRCRRSCKRFPPACIPLRRT